MPTVPTFLGSDPASKDALAPAQQDAKPSFRSMTNSVVKFLGLRSTATAASLRRERASASFRQASFRHPGLRSSSYPSLDASNPAEFPLSGNFPSNRRCHTEPTLSRCEEEPSCEQLPATPEPSLLAIPRKQTQEQTIRLLMLQVKARRKRDAAAKITGLAPGASLFEKGAPHLEPAARIDAPAPQRQPSAYPMKHLAPAARIVYRDQMRPVSGAVERRSVLKLG